MSVICAKVYKDKIVMCADSMVSNGYTKSTNGDFCKMIEINDMVIGASGTCEEASLMWHYARTHKPDGDDEKSILSFIVEFSQWKKGYIDSGKIDNHYLLAFDGKCFKVEKMFIYEVSEFDAVGCGDDFAKAVLHLGHTPRCAVEVASQLSCFCGGPILEFVMPR